MRRAARYDGLFPIEVDEEGLRSMLALVREERGTLEGFDVAVVQPGLDLELLGDLGVTWAMRAFWPGESLDEILAVTRAGPPTS